jgi:hypothetical protein
MTKEPHTRPASAVLPLDAIEAEIDRIARRNLHTSRHGVRPWNLAVETMRTELKDALRCLAGADGASQ